MKYVRKPSKITKEKTTTLIDRTLTGENGEVIDIDEITHIYYNLRFDGLAKLIIRSGKKKIGIYSHTIEDNKVTQRHDIIDDFRSAIEDKIQHTYQLVTGSRMWFFTGIFCTVLGLLASCMVVLKVLDGDDAPRKSFVAFGMIPLGVFLSFKSRVRSESIDPGSER